MFKRVNRNERRKIRHRRIRKKVFGTPERPRVNVYRSNRHVYLQVIDDTRGHTIVSAGSYERDIKEALYSKKMKFRDALVEVAKRLAKRALEKGITKVVFDKGGYKYHGNVKLIADTLRQEGLQF